MPIPQYSHTIRVKFNRFDCTIGIEFHFVDVGLTNTNKKKPGRKTGLENIFPALPRLSPGISELIIARILL